MKYPIAVVALLVFAACGRETVASKSAAAFREAQQKGTPISGDGHGDHGHSAATTTHSAAAHDHSTMTGMDHSTMTGMDHSTMTGMDHSKMTGMDHSKMSGMDHSKMTTDHSKMDHSKMTGTDHSAMDHSQMRHGQQSTGAMDHSKMQHGQQRPEAMDHSQMQHAQQPAAAMDHSQHGQPSPAATADHSAMGHGAGVAARAVIAVPTSNAEMQRARPAETLRTDAFDAPVAISVSEAQKAAQGGDAVDHTRHAPPPPPKKN